MQSGRALILKGHTRRDQQGIGIIEVLIALVVVSLGVLGMASLQITGMKHSASGYNRSMAVIFAENLSSRIRSNLDSVDAGDYAGYDSDGVNCSVPVAPICQTSYGVAATQCTPAEMARFDLFAISCGAIGPDGAPQDGISTLLSNGRLQVDCDGACVPNSNYVLRITWGEGPTTTDDEVQDLKTVELRFNP